MNWRTLTKAQRDVLVLKVLLAAVAVVGLFYLGIFPLMDRVGALQQKRDQLSLKLREGDAAVRGGDALRRQLDERRRQLDRRLIGGTPPASNPLLWATEVIYRHARATGVAVESVTEIKGDIPFWAKPPEVKPRNEEEEVRRATAAGAPPAPRPPPRRFAPYAILVNLVGSYDRLKAFAYSLESENPVVSMTTISIVAREATPEQHQVRLVVEWPRVMDSMQPKLKAIYEDE